VPTQQHSGFVIRLLCVTLTSTGLISCGQTSIDTTDSESPRYQATVVKTAHGIPHITANDWGSLGFAEAYSAAEDHVCNMALALLQSRGESAAIFGPGPQNRNSARDIVVKALSIPEMGSLALAQQKPDIKEWIEGYSAGYNQFLDEHRDGVGSWCNNEPWVRPAEASEFMAQYITLVYSLPRAATAIAAAKLPVGNDSMADIDETPASEFSSDLFATLTDLKLRDMGSNAWALAGNRTEKGRGLLLANPHYPWYGIARFWEKHLTIPGVYDAYGVSLIGTPGVALGFNENVGWSHTVSNSMRTVIYQLALNPENPTQYRWEDGWRDLSQKTVTVDVATEDGSISIDHKVWSSHHGPLMALPGLSAEPMTVFAVRDANLENIHTFAQWQAMAQAESMDDFIDAHRQFNAMPWINSIAASADGRAVYIDNSTVGALSPESMATWQAHIAANPRLQYLYLARGLVILDGSSKTNDWIETDSPVPNTEPFDRRPLIESENYVFNANDSYWLSDPENPAPALSPLYGATNSPRSVRTRMNIELLRPNSPLGFAGDDGKFNLTEVQDALFGNQSLTAQLLLPELLAECEANPKQSLSDGNKVDLGEACDVLAAWDQSFDSDSRGAVLFREWLTRYPYNETYLGNMLFKNGFDPANPATTPNGLANPTEALAKLAEATAMLAAAGFELDIALGELQRGHRADQIFPVHGGNRHEGIANLQVTTSRGDNPTETPIFTGSNDYVGDSKSLSDSGYNVVHGSSFIMTLSYTDEGPEAEAILSYSQSGDPESPYFSDQTALYRDKTWRKILFKPEAIAAGAISTRVLESDD
jgi:acyl-homoserine-lactone acylase